MPTTLTTLFFLTIFISPPLTEKSIDTYNEKTYENFTDDVEHSMSRVDSALSMSREIGYEYGEALALYQKGYLLDVMNEQGKALIANLSALQLLKDYNNEEAIKCKIKLYITTGLILQDHFKYDESIWYYKEGLNIATANTLDYWIAELNYKIGYSYKKQNNLDESLTWFKKAYEISTTLDDDYIVVNSLNMLGLAFSTNQNYEEARKYFNLVLKHKYRMVSKTKYLAKAYHNIANTYLSENNFDLAEANFQKALIHKEERQKVSEIFITKLDMANMYFLSGDLNKASEYGNDCVAYFNDLRNTPSNYKLFSLLRKIEFKKGEFLLSDKYANRYELENQKFIDRQSELIQIRDQFKMDILTTSYFSELNREKQIAQLWDAIYYILLFIFIGFTIWKVRQLYMKRMLEKELRTAIQDFNLDDL
ncbi:MAG: tetratricopeptide repeat protein [Bacteroidota bacterium]